MGKTEMSHARGWEGARGVRVRDGTRRAGRGCEGNVRRGLSGGWTRRLGRRGTAVRGAGVSARQRGKPRWRAGVSGYGVVAGASRAGSRVVGGAHLAEKLPRARLRLGKARGEDRRTRGRAQTLASRQPRERAPQRHDDGCCPPVSCCVSLAASSAIRARLERPTVVSRPTLDRRGRSGDARRRTRASRVASLRRGASLFP